ncbi:pentatricopeptide repeat-containing protein At5g11310, mitochondrial isoform X2 [Aristolochia californica]|uniref:pentatricopeptide repeat-containing protein At5g11310, mitochondrial isoform X2 n=1 Tax=Aristolochia californica TaxID=171875 RepID=UPI0035DEFD86
MPLHGLSVVLFIQKVIPNPILSSFFLRQFSSHLSFTSPSSSWLSIPGNPLLKWPPSSPKPPSPPLQTSPASQPSGEEQKDIVLQKLEYNVTDIDISAVSAILKDPCLSEADLPVALNRINVIPHSCLLETLVQNNNFSPNPILVLYRWACSYPEFCPSPSLINALVNLLARSRMFEAAWSLILGHLHQSSPPFVISLQTFALLIRRYARAGLTQSAIRTFEYLHHSKLVPDYGGSDGLDMLLDALCKEGHVSSAIRYLDQVSSAVPPLVIPSTRTYNILINGCFRVHKLRDAECIWGNMQKANIEPTVVTYGTLVEGYCKMRRVHRAVELLAEMSMKGIAPNVIVYNSIIDGLVESARFKDALAMLEKMPLYKLESTILTYNSLVRGYCKVGDLAGASKILKAMIIRGHLPTARTYNYFFAYFAKSGKVEEDCRDGRMLVWSLRQ